MNRVTLVGRLTKNPELRHTNTGTAVLNFTLAVNRQFKNQDGVREADFINMVAWRKTAELINEYLSKGSQIGVDGRIQTRNYEGEDGKRVYITEVVAETIEFLDTKKNNNTQPTEEQDYQYSEKKNDTETQEEDEQTGTNLFDDLPI